MFALLAHSAVLPQRALHAHSEQHALFALLGLRLRIRFRFSVGVIVRVSVSVGVGFRFRVRVE